ncbi:VOC family protein [Nocardia sp. NPDC051463]|uniref:VOC family protein n=1 Tax=Nocardia sp. NPDC051463 TaxID=3154845 RepID=UPI00344F9222
MWTAIGPAASSWVPSSGGCRSSPISERRHRVARKVVKHRLHFDWMPTERTREVEVERIIGMGATLHEDHRTTDGLGWVTLLDPEGNEFCLERSKAEREAREPRQAYP